jgi:hypothetical protein
MIKKPEIRTTIIIVGLVVLLILTLGISQVIILNKAHSSFNNYYTFRGCVQLLSKTDDYGICKITSGQTIKIVKIDNRWFLEGDGPGVW